MKTFTLTLRAISTRERTQLKAYTSSTVNSSTERKQLNEILPKTSQRQRTRDNQESLLPAYRHHSFLLYRIDLSYRFYAVVDGSVGIVMPNLRSEDISDIFTPEGIQKLKRGQLLRFEKAEFKITHVSKIAGIVRAKRIKTHDPNDVDVVDREKDK